MMITETRNSITIESVQGTMSGLIDDAIAKLAREKLHRMMENLKRLKETPTKNEVEKACRPLMIKALMEEIDTTMKYLVRWGEKF
jgi:hypothetical protein